jgi:hypothetical protein
MVGRQPYAPAASLSEVESTLVHMVLSEETRKKSPVKPPGILFFVVVKTHLYFNPISYTLVRHCTQQSKQVLTF